MAKNRKRVKDRRINPRYNTPSLKSQVALDRESPTESFLVRDMSREGCRLLINTDLKEPIETGQSLDLMLDDPNLFLTGTVMRKADSIEGSGVSLGIRFTNLTPATREVIDTLLKSKGEREVREHRVKVYRQRFVRRRARKLAIVTVLIFLAIIVSVTLVNWLFSPRDDEEKKRTSFFSLFLKGGGDADDMIEQYQKLSSDEKKKVRDLAK